MASPSWDLPEDYVDNGIYFEYDKEKGILFEVDGSLSQSPAQSDLGKEKKSNTICDHQQLAGTIMCLSAVKAKLRAVNNNIDLLKKKAPVDEPAKRHSES
jgi:hypothetical protein